MARRIFTEIVFALGLLCFTATAVNAQQVTFAISPSTLSPTPAVGDTVSLQISVTNFTNIVSFMYSIEWDPTLFSFFAVDNVNIADPTNFGTNGAFSPNTVIVGWNSTGGVARSLPNGQNIYRLRLKVKAASTNYWAKFSATNTSIEVVQYPSTVVTPAFGNLGNPPGTTTTPVTVQATASQTVPTQTKACVNVTANNFTNITSAQWVTKWDPTILRFDSISYMNNAVGFAATNFNSTQASGRLALNWAAPSSGTRSTTNGDLLYRVCYTAIGANGTSATISFDSAQIYQTTSGSSARIAMNSVNGTVSISAGQQSTGLIFTAPNPVVNQNDNICVQIKTAGFTNIATMTYAIFWDSTQMQFLSAKLANSSLGTDSLGTAGISNSFNNNPLGTLRCVWVTPTGNGITIPDSSAVMELCFKYTGAPGTSSPIRFGAYGAKLSVTDGNLAKITPTFRNGSVSVTGSSGVAISSTIKPVTCPSGTDGGVTLTPSGGTGSYTYVWSNGATTKDISNVAAGTYNVTVTSGTAIKTGSFTVTAPTAFSATSQVTNGSCSGTASGAIVLTVTGGTPQYSYLWSNNATTKDISGLVGGSYTVTITDSKGCTYTPAAILVGSSGFALTATKTDVSCKNGTTGAITTSVSGGTAPFTYSWVGNSGYANNVQNLSGLKADIYNLTVTDSKGCTATRKDTVREPDSLLIGAATVRSANCGASTGSITIAAITGGNGSNSFSWTGTNFTASTQNISALKSGQYTLTVKDANSCSSTATYTVSDSASSIVIGNPLIVNVKCNGANNGALTANATGGSGTLKYTWASPNGFNFPAQMVDGLKPGVYNLTVTDGTGCSKTASYNITEPAAITTAPSVTNNKCKGDAAGAIVLNPAGGSGTLSFAWSGVSATTQNLSGLKAGTYVVTVTDGNLCTKTQSFTITEPVDSLKVLSSNVTKVSCSGGPTGAISTTIGGGTQPFTFSWSGPANFTSSTQNIAALSAGTYSLTLKDANQCQFNASYVVDANSTINVVASVTDATSTPNGTITTTISGGTTPYTYLWSGQGVNPTSKDQTGLCPGSYSVTVTDAASCTSIKSVTVAGECSVPMSFGNLAIVPSGCPGQNLGKIDITVSGGASPYLYAWYDGSRNIIGRDRVLSGLTAGNYNLVVTDRIGQTKTETYTVPGSQTAISILSAAVTPETCTGNDGSISMSITGGAAPYKYYWADLSGDNQARDRVNIRAGNYTVQVRDNNGCLKDTNNIVIPRNPCQLVTITTKTDVKCYGDKNGTITINIQNGEPGYLIRWSPNDSVRINNQPSRNGNYTISGLASGLYTVTITDAKGQIKVESQTVGSSTPISIEKTISPARTGCDGAIVLSVSGGQAPYVYSWNTGATSRDLFGLCCDNTKKYSVTIVDAVGCLASTGNDTVSCALVPLTADAAVLNPICKSDSLSGRIEMKPVGGATPYTYVWANDKGASVGNGSSILTNVPPGKYYVTITDSRTPNPQRWQGSYELRVTSTLKLANLTAIAATDDLTTDGGASIDIQGGASDFNVTWCNGTSVVATNAARTPSVSNLPSGTCSVLVVDQQGCREKIDFVIPSKSCATIEILAQVKCYNDQNGSARIIKTSSDLVLPIQSYRWSSGEVGPIAFKLRAGLDTVRIIDANGKGCTGRVILAQPMEFKAAITWDEKNRAVDGSVTGGAPPYSLRWIPSNDTSHHVSVPNSVTVYLFASDRNGCNATDQKDIIYDAECLVGSSIISPNDDSRNEKFEIKTCDLKNIRLEVFNRWGQLVYSKDNYTSGLWQGNDQDGTSGKQLPDGVYMYVMKTTDSAGLTVLGKGTVTIVRQ